MTLDKFLYVRRCSLIWAADCNNKQACYRLHIYKEEQKVTLMYYSVYYGEKTYIIKPRIFHIIYLRTWMSSYLFIFYRFKSLNFRSFHVFLNEYIYKIIIPNLNRLYACLLTYLLTPWCRVLLEKLTGLQLVKKFPTFHGTRVHYRTHKRPPPVSILGQPKPVHIPTSHLLEIQPNIIHPSTPRSPQWSPSLRFPHQDPIHPPLLTHTRHMPSPSHSSRFYHPHNTGWGVQVI